MRHLPASLLHIMLIIGALMSVLTTSSPCLLKGYFSSGKLTGKQYSLKSMSHHCVEDAFASSQVHLKHSLPEVLIFCGIISSWLRRLGQPQKYGLKSFENPIYWKEIWKVDTAVGNKLIPCERNCVPLKSCSHTLQKIPKNNKYLLQKCRVIQSP